MNLRSKRLEKIKERIVQKKIQVFWGCNTYKE